MKSIFRLTILLLIALSFIGCDETPETVYYTPEYLSLGDVEISIRTQNNASRAAGLSSSDANDSVSFRSSDISMWGIDSVDDIKNLYTEWILTTGVTTATDITNEAISADLGDNTWSFSSAQSNIYAATDGVTSLPKKINIIRIDIGAGILTIVDDSTDVTSLYDSSGNIFEVTWEGSDYTGFDCNSIVLLDNTLLSKSVYVPRTTTADASSGLNSDEIAIVNEVISQGGMMDVDGALFIPMQSIDLSSYTTVSQVILDFNWDIDGAITYEGSNYVMDDRTGNGICFDFDVKITVVE